MSLVDVTAEAVPSSHPDEEVDPYLEVRVRGCDRPLLLIRGFELTAGPVPFAFRGQLPLAPGALVNLALLGSASQFVSRRPADAKYPSAVALDLVGNGKRQTILSLDSTESPPSLLWAGDIDRDGALDLLVEFYEHYTSSEFRLLLSSGAPPDALVRLLASYKSHCGC